ncbi:hypothetical protein ASG22_16530 [Chryseobacterium sp. Leaf405]|nr:hypothetical protein ASG22_16530 [Chryseobacterium sp. Leaf405]
MIFYKGALIRQNYHDNSIYFCTGYFKSSIETNESTFYIKNKEPITSKRYYRDLSGNWILLDKNVLITKDNWKSTSIKIN